MLGVCGGLERTDFNTFYFGSMWWSWKNWLLTLSTLGGHIVFERADFNTFFFGSMWWSWKNWFLTLFTLGTCGGLERTDF